MKFEPLHESGLDYTLLNPDAQTLVCWTDTPPEPPETVAGVWGTRAVAYLRFNVGQTKALILDLLNNPQVRSIVFLNDIWGNARAELEAFWLRDLRFPEMPEELQELVRQFVDLYDEDCNHYTPQAPYWPSRVTRTNQEN